MVPQEEHVPEADRRSPALQLLHPPHRVRVARELDHVPGVEVVGALRDQVLHDGQLDAGDRHREEIAVSQGLEAEAAPALPEARGGLEPDRARRMPSARSVEHERTRVPLPRDPDGGARLREARGVEPLELAGRNVRGKADVRAPLVQPHLEPNRLTVRREGPPPPARFEPAGRGDDTGHQAAREYDRRYRGVPGSSHRHAPLPAGPAEAGHARRTRRIRGVPGSVERGTFSIGGASGSREAAESG